MEIKKLIDGKRDRAVSPVIGVILMVAITVILAAIIGTFVIGLGGNIQTNLQAGASVQDNGNDRITTTFTSSQDSETDLVVRFDYKELENGNVTLEERGGDVINTGDTINITEVGNTGVIDATWSGGESVDVTVTVTAVNGDQRTAILTQDVTLVNPEN